MDRDGANALLRALQTYYPRVWPQGITPARAKAAVDDFEQVFAVYKTEDVLKVLYDWHLGSSQAPAVSDLIGGLRGVKDFEPISAAEYERPTVWTDYHEDDDGYGYATNSKTHYAECIWRPSMARCGKSKIRTLREHGVSMDGSEL